MIHYTDERVTLHHGDCLDVLRELPENSVDAVVTDPPYSLTDRREENCACDMLRDAIVTDAAHDVAHLAEQFVTLRVSCGIDSAAVVDGVHLDIEPQFGEVEVENDRATSGQCDGELVDMGNAVPSEQGSGGEFRLWVRQGHARCVGACRCLGKGSDGRIRVPVRLSHYPAGQAQRPASVVAVPAAELAAVLALDVARGTAELLPACGADALDPAFEIRCTEGIGALARAGGLPAVLESGAVGEVVNPAGGAASFNLLVHRTVLSWRPSVLRGFMASLWDGTGIETDARLWRECLRVLKPGGYCLAFGAPRTYHNLATAIEQSGFVIRDSITWLQGAGFPKSLDVSKALDKAAGAEREVLGPRTYGDGQTYNGGQAAGRSGGHMGHVVARAPSLETAATTDLAKKWQGWGTALKPASENIVVARKPLSGTVAANVTTWGTGALNIGATRVDSAGERYNTAPGSGGFASGYERGTGRGTPTQGRWPTNVVLTHAYECGRTVCIACAGTGQIRTCAACADPDRKRAIHAPDHGGPAVPCATCDGRGSYDCGTVDQPGPCVEGCPVRELDAQSGMSASSQHKRNAPKGVGILGAFPGDDADRMGHTDSGGASRFFPTFRYEAKAPTIERPRIEGATSDGGPSPLGKPRCSSCGKQKVNVRPSSQCQCPDPQWVRAESAQVVAHPTVKPLDLMRWLVRLVVPPGGTCLEPFAGSGTTAEACVIEGMHCIAIEREADYLPLIVARLSKPIELDLFGGVA